MLHIFSLNMLSFIFVASFALQKSLNVIQSNLSERDSFFSEPFENKLYTTSFFLTPKYISVHFSRDNFSYNHSTVMSFRKSNIDKLHLHNLSLSNIFRVDLAIPFAALTIPYLPKSQRRTRYCIW